MARFSLREITLYLFFSDSGDGEATGQVLQYGQNFRLGITGGFEDKTVSRHAACVLGTGRLVSVGLMATSWSGRRALQARAPSPQLLAGSLGQLFPSDTLSVGRTLFSMQLAKVYHLHLPCAAPPPAPSLLQTVCSPLLLHLGSLTCSRHIVTFCSVCC